MNKPFVAVVDSGTDPERVAAAGGRTRRWLEERYRDRARKNMRRKIRTAVQHLFLMETTLGKQDLAFTPVHQALQRTIKSLDEFRETYDHHTAE